MRRPPCPACALVATSSAGLAGGCTICMNDGVSGQVCALQAGRAAASACCMNIWQLGVVGSLALLPAACSHPLHPPRPALLACRPAAARNPTRAPAASLLRGLALPLRLAAGCGRRWSTPGGAGPQGRLWRLLAAAQPAITPLGPTWASVASFHTCWQLDNVVHCQCMFNTLQRMPCPLPKCGYHSALPATGSSEASVTILLLPAAFLFTAEAGMVLCPKHAVAHPLHCAEGAKCPHYTPAVAAAGALVVLCVLPLLTAAGFKTAGGDRFRWMARLLTVWCKQPGSPGQRAQALPRLVWMGPLPAQPLPAQPAAGCRARGTLCSQRLPSLQHTHPETPGKQD
jgi:hypothetical protein